MFRKFFKTRVKYLQLNIILKSGAVLELPHFSKSSYEDFLNLKSDAEVILFNGKNMAAVKRGEIAAWKITEEDEDE